MSLDSPTARTPTLWKRHQMAVDRVTKLRERILAALTARGVPHALVGGQAVAIWVATVDPDAVRTTKNVDILLRRSDLPAARVAALDAGLEYLEVVGVGMFLDPDDPSPRRGVHLLWADEKVKAEYPLPSPSVDDRIELEPGHQVVPLSSLLRMKLMAARHHDLAHISDLIDVGLITREHLAGLPDVLAVRLVALLQEQGR